MIWSAFGRSGKIRKQTLQLLSSMNRWCQVREDLLYAFQKCIDGGLDQPLRSVIEAFLTRVRGGMAIDQALDLMQKSLEHEHFQDFVASIRFNLHYRGDLPSLLEHLEWQMNRIEEEYTRRKLSNAHDRTVTAIIMIAVPICCALRLWGNPAGSRLFVQTGPGLALAGAGTVIYLLSVVTFILIQKKIND
ncbi:MAG: type II secretion system F family protein [Bacillota bacterium]|nr:type II secretion system F family protein [Bacillota bacterium]